MLLDNALPLSSPDGGTTAQADALLSWPTGGALASGLALTACGGGGGVATGAAAPVATATTPAASTTTTATATGSTTATTTTGAAGSTTGAASTTSTATTTTGAASTTTSTTATTTSTSTATSTSTSTAAATTATAAVTTTTGSTSTSTDGSSAKGEASGSVTVAPEAITPTQASRFLGQATMGATRAMIADVVAQGYDAWLAAQFALPRPTSHWDWLMANGHSDGGSGLDETLWRGMIADPDQLRQRVGMALLDFIVVGGTRFGHEIAVAGFVDVLLDNAFGNFRTLIEAVTYNPAMGSWLSYLNNRKASSTGSQPDENYARELMQLFTIGVYQLNMDGSVKMADGRPLETYTQADVSGLARIFTGLTLRPVDAAMDYIRLPMVMNASMNETGASTFLGTTVSGGGTAAIGRALDTIFAHPNVPPFVSRQLIQRLVTSNPSPAYISRVAAVFADNGHGVRGDMQAVIRAILTDMEARGDAALTSDTAGRLRPPVMRLANWARAFNATATTGAWSIPDTSHTLLLGQAMGRSPSVFNWFRPGYTPPNTGIAAAGLVAPEFQIADEQTVVAYVNYMAKAVQNGVGDVKPNYAPLVAMAADSAALVAEVNLLLAAGQLSTATVGAIRSAVDSISAGTAAGQQNRVYTAILLTLASPDYLTVR